MEPGLSSLLFVYPKAQQQDGDCPERLDQILDQINDQGIGSLTDSQRREMMKLRERLRGA